jgi:hypothetical protein
MSASIQALILRVLGQIGGYLGGWVGCLLRRNMYFQYSGSTWTKAVCITRIAGLLQVAFLTDEELARIPVDQITSHEIVVYEEGMCCLDIMFPETDLGPRIGRKNTMLLDEYRPGERSLKLPPAIT